MTTIYRYEINKEINEISIPFGAKILSVGIADNHDGKDVISLWAQVDTDAGFERRKFLVFGTGANMDALINFSTEFIGTVQKSNQYAFHVFEVNDKYNI